MTNKNVNVFLWPIRVYYEDTDSGSVVYYANYLKFMERARTEWLRKYGFEQDELINDHNVIFAVRSVTADYMSPARFNDELVVETRLVKLGKASITVEQIIKRKNEETVLCQASIKIASLAADSFKPKPMPETIFNTLN